ncbi:MAG: sporulation protein YunB [Clostridia bacterium]|nr:sporulation protein YunB [Clostridia bacterium]
MIECSTENIWYRKRRSFNKKRFSAFFIVCIILVAIFLYNKYVVSVQIYNICSNYAYSYSTEAVNSTVLESFDLDMDYSSLINIQKNNNGEIVLITADSQKINLISKNISVKTEKKLKEKISNGIPIPLFSFLGIELFSGYGPIIPYKTISVSSVECDFDSVFNSVGINQTLHSIYVTVTSLVKTQSIFNNKTITCENKILISETVLVGKVPEIYLNGKLFG